MNGVHMLSRVLVLRMVYMCGVVRARRCFEEYLRLSGLKEERWRREEREREEERGKGKGEEKGVGKKEWNGNGKR